MDAFVVRTPRNQQNNSGKKVHRNRSGKQRRLNDLLGVVVLEDIEKSVARLQDSKVTSREKRDILAQLTKKQPSTEIIIKSGIGKVVQTLMKDSDPDLAKSAREVKLRWQNLIERRVELSNNKLEVQTDLETRKTREKAVQLLGDKYGKSVSKETIKALEKRLYQHFRPIIGNNYRRSIRKIVTQASKNRELLEKDDVESVFLQSK